MIRRSLTSGNDRKDESRNAITNNPGPPREIAKALIHSTKPAIVPKCRLEALWPPRSTIQPRRSVLVRLMSDTTTAVRLKPDTTTAVALSGFGVSGFSRTSAKT